MAIYFYLNMTKGHRKALVNYINTDYVLLSCYLLNKLSHLFFEIR